MIISTFLLTEDGHHIPKHYSSVRELTGSVRDSIDIENPIIRVEHTGANEFNYIYVPQFGRYYYVQDRVQVRTGITDLICHVDVLESFYRQFIYSPMIASRSDSTYNKMIADGERTLQQDTIQQYVHIGRFSDDYDVILVGAGGQVES
jgi:hypothetical protein